MAVMKLLGLTTLVAGSLWLAAPANAAPLSPMPLEALTAEAPIEFIGGHGGRRHGGHNRGHRRGRHGGGHR